MTHDVLLLTCGAISAVTGSGFLIFILRRLFKSLDGLSSTKADLADVLRGFDEHGRRIDILESGHEKQEDKLQQALRDVTRLEERTRNN